MKRIVRKTYDRNAYEEPTFPTGELGAVFMSAVLVVVFLCSFSTSPKEKQSIAGDIAASLSHSVSKAVVPSAHAQASGPNESPAPHASRAHGRKADNQHHHRDNGIAGQQGNHPVAVQTGDVSDLLKHPLVITRYPFSPRAGQ